MKIQVVSDLHLEFGDCQIDNAGADVLVLSGDIGIADSIKKYNTAYGFYQEFFEHVAGEFKDVIYTMGNHEHYHGEIDTSYGQIQEAIRSMGINNIHLMEQEAKVIDNVVFIGGTLWTNMNNYDPLTMFHIREMMNDFRNIRVAKHGYRKFTPRDATEIFSRTVNYIDHVIDNNPDKDIVVCTHHAPSFHSIPDEYKSDTLMNGGYASNLEDFILNHPRIKLWTHGHTHGFLTYMIGECQVVNNARGYKNYGENTGFDPNFIVELT